MRLKQSNEYNGRNSSYICSIKKISAKNRGLSTEEAEKWGVIDVFKKQKEWIKKPCTADVTRSDYTQQKRDISQTGEQTWERACSIVKPMIWRPTVWKRKRRRKRNTCWLRFSDWYVGTLLGSMRKVKNTQIIANCSLSNMREQHVRNADILAEHCRITSLFFFFLFSWTNRLGHFLQRPSCFREICGLRRLEGNI